MKDRHIEIIENLIQNEITEMNNDIFRDEKYYDELFDVLYIIQNFEFDMIFKTDK